MSSTEENEAQRELKRLVRDLESKEALCCCDDYPAVSEEILNDDEGYFIPGRDVVDGCCELTPMIATQVSHWAKWSGERGEVMLSKGAYLYDKRARTPTTVRMPDVTFTPRRARRDPSAPQLWILHSGELYAPSFVVEIDRLSGEDSQLDALDAKMRDEFFPHGVQLGWLIDPRPECRKMIEYKLNEAGQVYREQDETWRGLDGGEVFTSQRRIWR